MHTLIPPDVDWARSGGHSGPHAINELLNCVLGSFNATHKRNLRTDWTISGGLSYNLLHSSVS